MAGLETLALVASAGAGLAGTVASARAQKEQGEAAQRASEMEAAAREREAREREAASQREAISQQKKTDLALSRQQAVAAGSGAGATDATVLDLMGDVAAAGEYNERSALYEGTASARGLDEAADLARFKGEQARKAGKVQSQATILSGLSSFAGTLSKAKFPTSFGGSG